MKPSLADVDNSNLLKLKLQSDEVTCECASSGVVVALAAVAAVVAVMRDRQQQEEEEGGGEGRRRRRRRRRRRSGSRGGNQMLTRVDVSECVREEWLVHKENLLQSFSYSSGEP